MSSVVALLECVVEVDQKALAKMLKLVREAEHQTHMAKMSTLKGAVLDHEFKLFVEKVQKLGRKGAHRIVNDACDWLEAQQLAAVPAP